MKKNDYVILITSITLVLLIQGIPMYPYIYFMRYYILGSNAFKNTKITMCVICHEEYSEDPTNECIVLLCGHDFHKTCIKDWLAGDYSCPTCRRNVRDDKERFPSLDIPSLTCKEYKILLRLLRIPDDPNNDNGVKRKTNSISRRKSRIRIKSKRKSKSRRKKV